MATGTTWSVFVGGFDDRRDELSALTAAIESAWTGPGAIKLCSGTIEAIDSDSFKTVDVVVLDVTSAPSLRPVTYLANEIEESGVPVITLTKEPDPVRAPRLFTLSPDDPRAIAAAVSALIHRNGEVTRLNQELQIAQRCHGGIHGEITRIHEELQLAAMMQREFLPREMPKLGGVEFGALWRPAHYVSGDIYAFPRLDDDHIGIFLADCVGHGVPAALMTMLICRSLTTAIRRDEDDGFAEPSVVLDRLNRDLVRRNAETTRFATAVYGILNCHTRELRMAGAGHPPPLILKSGHPDRDLPTSGGLLGVFEDAEYDQIETWLEPGERLMLFSDGFEQAFPESGSDAYGQRLPTERYRDEFRDLSALPSAQASIEQMMGRLNDQQGSLHQADDLTLLCVHAGAVPAETHQARAVGKPAVRR